MSLTDKKEKSLLYERVCDLNKNTNINIISEPEAAAESYYISRKEEAPKIREYSIQNITDLRRELEDMWEGEGLDSLIPIIIAAAFKEKQENGGSQLYEEDIPAYIYNF